MPQSLWRSRRFYPLFITQFLGAFNDNLLKNSLVMLITYQLAAQTGQNAQIMVTLAAALFILPFFLFSATAGQLADKYDRARITRLIKLAEILIMIVAVLGFYLQHLSLLLVALFAMGAHSSFFGPIKYALLPQHLQETELLTGNAYIEAGTFLAILLGTILGGVLILQINGALMVSIGLMLTAIAGYAISRHIPDSPAADPDLRINPNIAVEIVHIIGHARQNRRVFLAVIGISWFWLVGATYLSQLPTYVKDVLHAEAAVVTCFLTIFSIGIGIGSLVCNRVLKGRIETIYVPFAALGMAVFGIDLYVASAHPAFMPKEALMTLAEYITTMSGIRIIADLLGIAICAGLYIVPLYALMQHDSNPQHRARIIAANNIMNALFMVVAAVITLIMLKLRYTIPDVFLAIAAANGLVAIYLRRVDR